jgi:RNA polymerase sigma-70 factor (ECF subfamily)
MLLVDARRDTRLSDDAKLVLLSDQDRSRWDRAQIDEGVHLTAAALTAAARAGQPPARYALQAAIAAVHAEAPSWEDTDWDEIVGLYDVLGRLWPSPVIELNRAVAIGLRDGPAAGLLELTPLLDEPALATYAYLSAARADFLRRLGRRAEAAVGYEEAVALSDNDVERAFLVERLDEVRRQPT